MTNNNFLFKKKNYILMLVGLLVIALGFILMSGGGDNNPEEFNEDVYSLLHIGIAPSVVIMGFAIEAWAIFVNDKEEK